MGKARVKKAAKRPTKQPESPQDLATKAFAKGVDLIYKKKWSAAEKIFAGISEELPGSTLAERSRRFLSVCKERSNESPDGGDKYLNAVHAKNRGDLDTAMEYCDRGGLKGRDDRFAYLAAAVHGLRENHEEAAKLLEQAIEMNPANRVHAFHDPDFLSLRADPEFAEVFSID